jgi:hypothetical protein
VLLLTANTGRWFIVLVFPAEHQREDNRQDVEWWTGENVPEEAREDYFRQLEKEQEKLVFVAQAAAGVCMGWQASACAVACSCVQCNAVD